MTFQECERKILDDLIKQRGTLDLAIARLEESLSQPPYVSHLDFKEIEKEAKEFNEFLQECERKRLKKEEEHVKPEG